MPIPKRTLSVVMLLCALWVGCTNRTLEDRVRLLREQMQEVPTSAGNYVQRLSTLEDWRNDLASRGRLRIPTVVAVPIMQLRFAGQFSAETPDLIARIERTLAFVEEHGDRIGTLERVDEADLVANEFATIVLEYTVGDVAIETEGLLRIGQIFSANKVQPLQNTDPTADAHVSFEVTGDARTSLTMAPFRGVFGDLFSDAPGPALRVDSGSLKRGDRVRITLGDRSQGSRGLRMMPRDADAFRFVLLADPRGEGVLVPAGFVSVSVRGASPEGLRAVVPSIVAAGEPFSLRLAVEDRYFSPATYPGGTFSVRLLGKEIGEIEIPAGRSEGKLDGLVIDSEGGFRFEVASKDSSLLTTSNPVLVEADPKQRIYWGELHGHSGLEDAIGTVSRYYEYARDVAFLDFGSLTGHDVALTAPGWKEIREATEKANRAGSFVAFMGYEWSVNYQNGGHHNVFFKNDPGRYVTYRDTIEQSVLYQRLKEIQGADNVLVIPHAHEPGNWKVSDPEIERLVEMYSMHGSFEYFGQRYLDQGYRVGLIAASDDHTGHPGNAPATISTRGGLAAVYAPRLDRENIWRGLTSRATYATSGKRAVAKISIDGGGIGQEISAGAPTFKMRVLGTAAIDHIDLIQNGKVVYSQDYARSQKGSANAVQIMFHSPTETPGNDVRPPLHAVKWNGWLEVDQGRIQSIEPLGLDHFTDQFRQVDSSKVWFSCKVRGDVDGLFLHLGDSPKEATITIRIGDELDREGSASSKGLTQQPGPPIDRALHQLRFEVRDLAPDGSRFDLSSDAVVFARLAAVNGPWDVSFDYRPTEAPKPNDYFYLRAVQIDGETVWTSPIWIGGRDSR